MSTQEERDNDPIVGHRVRTCSPATSDLEWSYEARALRKWNVIGHVIDLSNSHGLCYEVEHEDGTRGWYDPKEIRVEDEDDFFVARRTDNPTMTVDLMMQHDGCKIYRFTDNGYHYFVRCADSKIITTENMVKSGKTYKPETVVTVNE